MRFGTIPQRMAVATCLSFAVCGTVTAQSSQTDGQQKSQYEAQPEPPKENATGEPDASPIPKAKSTILPENDLGLLIKNLASDQKAIWTSPARIRMGDATWLVPFAGLTAGFLVTDHDAVLHLSHSPTTVQHYTSFSNYGIAGMAGAGAGLYLLGKVTHDEHKRETGFLSGEAALDGLFVATTLQYEFGRGRPSVDSYHGKFFQGGNSFPSDHATAAWAIASVISHEDPGPFTKNICVWRRGCNHIRPRTGWESLPCRCVRGQRNGLADGLVCLSRTP